MSNYDEEKIRVKTNDATTLYNNSLKRVRITQFYEILGWTFVGILVVVRPLVEVGVASLDGRPANAMRSLALYLPELVFGIIISLFPYLFKTIFGTLPIALLKQAVSRISDKSPTISAGGNVYVNNLPSAEAETIKNAIESKLNNEMITAYNPRQLMAFYSERSNTVANKIFSRAGVYLLMGTLISFMGLIVFYTRTQYLPVSSDYITQLLALAPNFGVLFFIEFVAIFF